MIWTSLVELHLDDVLEVLLVVGVEFLSNETCINKLEINTKGRFNLTFDFALPCKTSPRRYSRGSLDGWSWISFLRNLYINTKGRFAEKIIMIDL